MKAVFQGSQSERGQLSLYLKDGQENPFDAYSVTYSFCHWDGCCWKRLTTDVRAPEHPALGEYYVYETFLSRHWALGSYAVRWEVIPREGEPVKVIHSEFDVVSL